MSNDYSVSVSADTGLLFDIDEPSYDPAEIAGADNNRLAIVWPRSDALRKQLTERSKPDSAGSFALKASLISQLQTLFIYWQMHELLLGPTEYKLRKSISLYVILFPGEAKDNTGVKDLNDKVIGQWWNSQFMQLRYDAIRKLFDEVQNISMDGFIVAGQTYKTAFILTSSEKREDFAVILHELDNELRMGLLDVMKQALEDTKNPPSKDQKKEINKLTKKLSKNKNYSFDIYFGFRTLDLKNKSVLEDVYLLVTEAMKGAAISRYVTNSKSLARLIGAQALVKPDAKKLDPRGKEYDWQIYLRASNQAEKIKDAILQGKSGGWTADLNSVYVDTVWTTAYLLYKNLYWGNPDVMRDVRKKKLEPPPKMQSGGAFKSQKFLLESWLVVLNLLDFVKSFKSEEFRNALENYHNRALKAFVELGTNSDVDWDNLIFVLTYDVRQRNPIAINGTASEFQFYSAVSDHLQRIFLSMDIRDLGVDLLLNYEFYNREIGHKKYSDLDLMWTTLRATDDIDERRRVTYDTVVKITRKYYDQLSRSSAGAPSAATRAFGTSTDVKLGSFGEAVQIMLGGDEVYVALHPHFTVVLHELIGEVTQASYGDSDTLNLRASVAFSTAEKKQDPTEQRKATQLSHQEAMKIADDAPALLKRLERTDRRIERLIEMIEANDKKKGRAPGYRKELDDLGLRRLFARSKYGKAKQLAPAAYQRLLAALRLQETGKDPKDENLPDLVDFAGKVVEYKTIAEKADELEKKVRKDVGYDNVKPLRPAMPGAALAKKLEKFVKKVGDIIDKIDPIKQK